ncbi:MAG: DUF1573 domain-containing protein [Bacteroidota bacterium]|nr:DUF1573 domain-containing protein [Bacteroidota bacterium]
MKKEAVISLIFFILSFPACNSGAGKKIHAEEIPQAEGETAQVIFREYEHDFGKIIEGEKVAWTFNFENRGPGRLVINSATTTCGCTVTKFSRDPIPAGGGGSLEVVFDSEGKSGKQTKTISVHSNSQTKVVILKITAEVISKNNN